MLCELCNINISQKGDVPRHNRSVRHQTLLGNNIYETESKIYKIVNTNTGKTYIGSTVKPLKKRLQKHQSDKRRYYNNKKVRRLTSYDLLDGNEKIELLEQYNCKSRRELLKREQEYLNTMECVNKMKAICTNS
jgi:predicted GIY-YIG superfamily endonuclease